MRKSIATRVEQLECHTESKERVRIFIGEEPPRDEFEDLDPGTVVVVIPDNGRGDASASQKERQR